MKLLNAKKSLLVMTLSSYLAGCASIPFDLPFSDSNEKEDVKVTNFSKPSSSSGVYIEAAEIQRTHNMLVDHLSEWSAVKGDINRLLDLEAELAYLVDALQQQDELVMFVEPNEVMQEFSEPEALLLKDETQTAPSSISNQFSNNTNVAANSGVNNTKFSGAKPTPVQKFAAPKLPSTGDDSLDGVDKDKFSTASVVSVGKPTPQLEQQASSQSNCQPNYNNSGKYGLHLISVSSDDNISQASQQIIQKYSNLLCGKYLKISKVSVRDTEFNSLRFGPYNEKADAQLACTEIQSTGQYCSVASFDGYTYQL